MHRQRDVNLLEVTLLDPRAPDEASRLRSWRRRPVEAGEPPFNLRHDGFVIDGTGGGNDHVRSSVVARQVLSEPSTVERTHRCGSAENRSADRLIAVSGLL